MFRRIISKSVTKVTKQNVIGASGSLWATNQGVRQLYMPCAKYLKQTRQMRLYLSTRQTPLTPLIGLHNIRVLCPMIATYAINAYRASPRLFVIGGKELESYEGSTQGNPLAMSGQSTPFDHAFKHCKLSKAVLVRRQCYRLWVTGRYETMVRRAGGKWPGAGIFPKCKKMQPCKEEAARELFTETAINTWELGWAQDLT